MPRKIIYLEYLNKIPSINEFLKNISIRDKTLRSYYLALDKFFPFLLNRFKEDYEELKEFNLDKYYSLDTDGDKQFKKDLESKHIYDRIFEETWKNLNPNTKSNLLMKWVDETHDKGLYSSKADTRNTFLNYLWQIQGFFSKLGFEYKANPKNMEKIKSNGFHLSEEITYEDVVQLYERIDNIKYKLILKIMMYCGLNPADIVLLKPKDFKRYRNSNYYVLVKAREKTKKKNAQFLIIFHKNFIEELKDYFERNIQKTLRNTQKTKIKKLKEDPHYKIIGEYPNTIKFEGSYSWKKDANLYIFRKNDNERLTGNNVIDAINDHVNKNNLSHDIMASSIRRLCFTMIKSVFTLEDSDIYNLWTQHKEGILTRNYITDLVDRSIKREYVEKISEKVLIGNVEKYIREVKDLKNGMNRVRELEKTVSLLLDFVKPKRTKESLESELRELETNKEARERTKEMLKSNLPNGYELHENDLDVYIEDLKDDIKKLETIEQLENSLKSK